MANLFQKTLFYVKVFTYMYMYVYMLYLVLVLFFLSFWSELKNLFDSKHSKSILKFQCYF